MAESIKAYINNELLIWARKYSYFTLDEVADKLKIKVDRLRLWEEGSDLPTINQLRKLAKTYRQPFTLFYLPKPPNIQTPKIEDYRKIPSIGIEEFSKELIFEIRDAMDKRGIMLELMKRLNQPIKRLSFSASVEDDPEIMGLKIREILKIDASTQFGFDDQRKAFNSWRSAFENLGILVFQSAKVSVETMRGLSIAFSTLPIIIINRKDSYTARIFSLLHEFAHLILHNNGICDLHDNVGENKIVEIYANQIAASTLIPQKWFLTENIISSYIGTKEWRDEDIVYLANRYNVSREVILRRLLSFGLTSSEFYNSKRMEYLKDIKRKKQKSGFITPAIDVISKSGKKYTSTIFDAYLNKHITESTVSEYLGVKNKHFNKIRSLVGV